MDHSNDLRSGVLDCLRYFGLFKYPLTSEEVHRFCGFKASHSEVFQQLTYLHRMGEITREKEYFLYKSESSWIERRELGNSRAKALLQRSKKFSRIISSFPFVKGVAISGSLSKNYAGENDDVDYFIVTAHNRLWIARTMLHVMKKLSFLTGHEHFFCMNYFVDESALELPHQNLYTAIELSTLLPVYGYKTIDKLKKRNSWSKNYLPNFKAPSYSPYLIKPYSLGLKSMGERLINLFRPRKFNYYLMRLTDKKWRAKWSHLQLSEQEYRQAFYTDLHVSKNHPQSYQPKVLTALKENDKMPLPSLAS